LKQAAISARQLKRKINSEFWRDFGDQKSKDSSPSRTLLTIQFPFLKLRYNIPHSSFLELEKKAVETIAKMQ